MEKQRLKRILAFILSLLMMINSSGIMAYADENDQVIDPSQQKTPEMIKLVDAIGYEESTGVFDYDHGTVEVKFEFGDEDYNSTGTPVDENSIDEIYIPEDASSVRVVLYPENEYKASCTLPEEFEDCLTDPDENGNITMVLQLQETEYTEETIGIIPSFTNESTSPASAPSGEGLRGSSGEDQLKLVCYKDEDHTQSFEINSNGEPEIRNTPTGVTFYAKASAGDDVVSEIVGFYPLYVSNMDDGIPSEYIETISGNVVWRSVKEYSSTDHKDEAVFEIPADYNDRLWGGGYGDFYIISKYTFTSEDNRVEYKATKIKILYTYKGIWGMTENCLEYEEGPNGADLSTIGKREYAYFQRNRLRMDTYDTEYVLFHYNDEESYGDEGMTPITSGFTVKEYKGGETEDTPGAWVDCDKLKLEYVGNTTGLPEGFVGLWKVTTTIAGVYRLYRDDGYIDIEVNYPPMQLFATDDMSDISHIGDYDYYVGNNTPVRADVGAEYILYNKWNSDYMPDLDIIIDGEIYTRKFEEEGWKTTSEPNETTTLPDEYIVAEPLSRIKDTYIYEGEEIEIYEYAWGIKVLQGGFKLYSGYYEYYQDYAYTFDYPMGFSQKGLVVSNRPFGYISSDWKSAELYKSIVVYTGVDNNLLFAWSNKDTIPVTNGEISESDARIIKDFPTYETKFNEVSGEYEYSADIGFSYSEDEKYLHVFPTKPGLYRIAKGDETDSSINYVDLIVMDDPRLMECYKDSDYSIPYEETDANGQIRFYNTYDGVKVYAKAVSTDESTPEILGFYRKPEDVIWSSGHLPQNYCTLAPNISMTYDGSRDKVIFQMDRFYDRQSFVILAKYTYPVSEYDPMGRVEYKTFNYSVRFTEEGLKILSKLEWQTGSDGPDLKTIHRKDGASWTKAFNETYMGDKWYVLIRSNTADVLDENSMTPVTGGLTVYENRNGALAESEGITLTYKGDLQDLPDGFTGLWEISANYPGHFYVFGSDGKSFININVNEPAQELYRTNDLGKLGDFNYMTGLKGPVIAAADSEFIFFDYDNWGGTPETSGIRVNINGVAYSHAYSTTSGWVISGTNEPSTVPDEYLTVTPLQKKINYNVEPTGPHATHIYMWGIKVRQTGFDLYSYSDGSMHYYFEEGNFGLVLNPTVQFDERFPVGDRPVGTLENANDYVKDIKFNYTDTVWFALGVSKADGEITDPASQVTRLNSITGLKVYKDNTEIIADENGDGLTYIGEYTYRFKAPEAGTYRLVYTDNKGNRSSLYLNAGEPAGGLFEDAGCTNRINLEGVPLTIEEATTYDMGYVERAHKEFYLKVPKKTGYEGTVELSVDNVQPNGAHVKEEFTLFNLSSTGEITPDLSRIYNIGGCGITYQNIYEDTDNYVYKITLEDSIYCLPDEVHPTEQYYIALSETDYEFKLHLTDATPGSDSANEIKETYRVDLDKCVLSDDNVVVIINDGNPYVGRQSESKYYYDTVVKTGDHVISQFNYRLKEIDVKPGIGEKNITYEASGGNFTGTFTGKIVVNPKSIEEYEFKANEYYSPIDNKPRCTFQGPSSLNLSSYEYEFRYKKNGDVYEKVEDDELVVGNTYYARFNGIGDYTGVKYVPYTYKPYEISVSANLLSSQNVKATYDGTKKSISPIIKAGETTLIEGIDYTIAYYADGEYNNEATVEQRTNVTNAPVYALVTCKGNYSGTIPVNLTIIPADMSKATVKKLDGSDEVNFPAGIDYSAFIDPDNTDPSKPNGIAVVVKLGDKTLEKGTDYTVDFTKAVGRQNFVITGIGNYTGSITKPVTIKADTTLNARTAIVTVSGNYAYTGDVIVPEVAVKMSDGTELVNGTDYEVVATAVKAGRATAKINGLAEAGYTGSLTATYTIEKRDLSDVNIALNNNTFTYAIGGVTPAVSVKIGETELVQGTDYTVTYADNKATGSAKAIVAVKTTGSLTGTAREIPFTIVEKKIDGTNADIAFVNTVKEYYAVNSGDYVAKQAEVLDGTTVLAENKDYTLTVEPKEGSANAVIDSNGNLKAGTKSEPAKYTFKFTGIGNYSGNYSIDAQVFAYNKTDIKTAEITGINSEYVYTGSAITPAVTVKVGDTTLDADDYTVTYENNVNVGTGANALAKVNIIGKGDYEGSVTKTFKITPKEISDVGIAPQNGAYALVTNNAYVDSKNRVVATTFDVYYKWSADNVDMLTLNKDYTVVRQAVKAIDGYDVKVNITFKGDYTGVVKDVPIDKVIGQTYQYAVSVTGIRNLTYNGNAQTQRPAIKANIYDNAYNVADLAMTLNTDYELSYHKLDEYGVPSGAKLAAVRDAGTYCMSVKFKGKYSDSIGEKYLEDEYGNYYTFEVAPLKLAAGWAVLQTTVPMDYSASYIAEHPEGYRPVATVTYNRAPLTEGVDYDVDYTHNSKPGTGHAVITGKGNFTGEVVKDFTINGSIDISTDEDIAYDVDTWAYYTPARGGALPFVQVTYAGEELEQGKDYTIAGKNNTKIFAESGTYATLTITGKGKYKGSIKDIAYQVVPSNLSDDYVLSGQIGFGKGKYYAPEDTYYLAVNYTGKEQKPDPMLKLSNVTLKFGKDYEVSYYSNSLGTYVDSVKNAGIYKVEVSGTGNYVGTVSEEYIVYVVPKSVKNLAVTVKSRNYTGEPITNAVTEVRDGRDTLVNTKDYGVTYASEIIEEIDDYWYQRTGMKIYKRSSTGSVLDFTNPGSHKAYVVGMGNYSGVKVVNYTINGYALSRVKFVADEVEFDPTTGKISDATPLFFEGTYAIDRTTTIGVDIGEDFDIVNTGFDGSTGRKTATLQGKGRFTGTANVTYNVKSTNLKNLADDAVEIELSDSDGTITDTYDYAVNGVKPNVKVLYEGEEIPAIRDGKATYTLLYANNRSVADKDVLRAPKVTVRFTPYSGLAGNKEATFSIIKADISDQTATIANVVSAVNAKTGYVNTYKATPVIKGEDGATLRLNTHYTITYVYAEPTMVFDGKNLVQRAEDSEVKKNDKFKAGTKLRVVVTGKGMVEGTTTLDYYVLAK